MKKTYWLAAFTALTFLPSIAGTQTSAAQSELSLPLANGDAWVFNFDLENDIATHRLTGFQCPTRIPGGYSLGRIVQAGLHGAPAQCTYVNQSNGGFSSLSVNYIYTPGTAKTDALRRLSVSEGGKNFQAEDLTSEAFETDFNGVPAEDCHRLYLPFVSERQSKHEKVLACNFGKWNFIINQTAPLSDTSFDEIFSWSRTAQTDMAGNMDACIAPTTKPATEITADTPGNNKLLVDILEGEVVSRAVIGSTSATGTLMEDQCMIAYLNTEQANLLIMRDKSRDTAPLAIYPARLKGIDPKPTIWVAEVLQLNADASAPKTYAMFGQAGPGVQHIHKLYQGAPPNDQQFIQDAQLLFTNQLPSRAYLESTQPGKWTWTIPLAGDE